MKNAVVLSILALALISSTPAQTPEPVSAAFKKIQSLRGEWEGNDEHGGTASTNFKLVVAGTTVMESLVAGGMEEMLTLYTIDGDRIALVHYCPTDNQPRMRATPRSGDVKQLVFQFAGAGNLPTLSMGHEHKLVIRLEDENHITEEWTWRRDGKDTLMVYHFTRKKK
jgi:hypothetical protein